MAAAANRNLQSPIAGESQRGEDVGRTGAAGDEGGTLADRPVPDRTDLFVAFIERAEQRSGKVRSELLYVGVDEAGVSNHACGTWDSNPLPFPDAKLSGRLV
jgi:hypothetical protein